jgi:hypothetical protein
LSVCLYIYILICRFFCISIYPSIQDIVFSIHLYIYLSLYLSVCISVCLSVRLSICQSICLSLCLSIYLSIYNIKIIHVSTTTNPSKNSCYFISILAATPLEASSVTLNVLFYFKYLIRKIIGVCFVGVFF